MMIGRPIRPKKLFPELSFALTCNLMHVIPLINLELKANLMNKDQF
jgi:hypothetical protein